MECDFCGEQTTNKYNNQPRCKIHVVEARRKRDEHNQKIKDEVGPQAYAYTVIMEQYIPENPLEDKLRTTAGYHLNKMYKELGKEKAPAVEQPSQRF